MQVSDRLIEDRPENLMLSRLLITSGIWTLASASISLVDYQPVNCRTDTPWIPGSGSRIRLLLQSILSRFATRSDELAAAIFEQNTQQLVTLRQNNVVNPLGWRKFGLQKHDGWLYGSFSDDASGEDVYYLYSNLHTAIRGKFIKGKLLHGREVAVTHYRCRNELLELQFSEPVFGSPVYTYEEPTEMQLTSRPTLMDPLDRCNVYVGPSTLGSDSGEGLFARRSIPTGDPICIYAGARVHISKRETLIFHPNMTFEERERRHANLMTLDENYLIDVPEDDVVKYRASLGHKAQHTFMPNAVYRGMRTPRFGDHICLEALEDIKKGQEIFVSYNYQNLKDGFIPRWYRALFAKEFPDRAHEAYPD